MFITIKGPNHDVRNAYEHNHDANIDEADAKMIRSHMLEKAEVNPSIAANEVNIINSIIIHN